MNSITFELGCPHCEKQLSYCTRTTQGNRKSIATVVCETCHAEQLVEVTLYETRRPRKNARQDGRP